MTRDEQQRFYDDTVAALSQGDRIAQLEAQNLVLNGAARTALNALIGCAPTMAHMEAIAQLRAALAKAGASQ